MEHPVSPDLPELENWAHCQEILRNNCSFLFPWPPNTESSCFTSCSVLPIEIKEEDRSSAATASTVSKNHSEAEKRRRDRINIQLALLRNIIPHSDKMDKAALLGSVVKQLKDLRREAKEVSKVVTVPSDVDEITIDCFLNQDRSPINSGVSNENILIRTSICCDDRPDLFTELTQAFKTLSLTIVRADMACLGGRIKSVLVLCTQNGKDGALISSTIQALKGFLSRIVSSSSGLNGNRNRSKRQKFFSSG